MDKNSLAGSSKEWTFANKLQRKNQLSFLKEIRVKEAKKLRKLNK